MKGLSTLTHQESEELFEEVRGAIEDGHKWYQRAGYIDSEDVNKVIRLVEARLLRKGRSKNDNES